MNLHDLLLGTLASISVVILVLFLLTLYEFLNLDKELFRDYIIGLAMVSVGILCFIFRYIIFPPLSEVENIIFGFGIQILPAIFMFYLLHGTEKLARQEKADFKKDEKMYTTTFYLFIILVVFQVAYMGISLVSEKLYEILNIGSIVIYSLFLILILLSFLEYKKAFGPPIDKVIYSYMLAIILLAAGGIITTSILFPLEDGNKTFTDLSYLRNIVATVGALVTIQPAIISYRSVFKFRKMLSG